MASLAACGLPHSGLMLFAGDADPTVGDLGVDMVEPDVVDAGSDESDAMDAIDATDAVDSLDVADAPDVFVEPDVLDVADTGIDVPMDVPVVTDVPTRIAAGGECGGAGPACVNGTRCTVFAGGDGTTAATVCTYCGHAGQSICPGSTGCVAGTLRDDQSGLCVLMNGAAHCGEPGGGCRQSGGCAECPAWNQCFATDSHLPNACRPCGHPGEPCCCGAAGNCACEIGTCARGGSNPTTVCH